MVFVATTWDASPPAAARSTLTEANATPAGIGQGLRTVVMISGGGTQAGGGLGFFIWNSFMGGSLEQVVVGMISIGIAGYLSSSAVRAFGDYFMPWRRLF